MNLQGNPELLDRLAASYAIGTLRGGARRRFESLARENPSIRAVALVWQERFASLTELQPQQAPGPNVWKRIENLLPRDAVATASSGLIEALRRRLRWWRGTAVAGLAVAATVAGVSVNLGRMVEDREAEAAQVAQQRDRLARENTQLAATLRAQPEVQYVAVLGDDKAAPQVLVTFDPKHSQLTLKHVGNAHVDPGKSLQLWALPPGGAPRSLGVLGSGTVVRMPAAENQVREAPALAISLEPQGGAPAGSGPTGPVLFKGPLLQTSL